MQSTTPDNPDRLTQELPGEVPDSAPRMQPGTADVIPDPEGDLTKVHPNYKSALRLQTILFAIPFLIGALIAETAIPDDVVPPGVIAGPVLLLAVLLVIRVPGRRFNARGYDMSDDRLRVVRGIWWHSDTVVPFGRVQHIDVDQGPIERFFDIATLTLHTAGNHNASVHLPGLQQDLAKDMREDIRAHIKRESV